MTIRGEYNTYDTDPRWEESEETNKLCQKA